jgi:hypothetical protein
MKHNPKAYVYVFIVTKTRQHIVPVMMYGLGVMILSESLLCNF